MKYRHFHITILLISLISGHIYAQENCTVPLAPVLTSVSVEPETSRTEFTWLPSESTDIAAYIIYAFKNGDGQAIDTVWNPAATSDIITNTAPKYSSVSYVVAAHRLSAIPGQPGCTSPLSNVLSTIFCQVALDTCNRKIDVSWNAYPSVPRLVESYSVMLSVNGSSYNEATVTDPSEPTFSYDNFITDAEYCFYIKANINGGFSSTSNKVCILTKMQRPPDWINADYATVDRDKISVSFTVDPLSQINQFVLERKSGTTGSFEQISTTQSIDGRVSYTDTNADTGTINYYRLSAINSCNIPITVSNIASNMVLDLKLNRDMIDLTWNHYYKWLGSISDYRLFVNTGENFTEKAIIPSTDSTLSFDYRDLMYDITSGQVCFYITATESANPYSVNGQSKSQQVCTEPLEVITVPNIFTPNNDLKNDLFKPVLSFTSVSYQLIISDQHGKVLFETRDQNESWNGTIKGTMQPDGVCLWFLKVTTPSGKKVNRRGTVTILREP
jgi:gliding motility-associated-like protein